MVALKTLIFIVVVTGTVAVLIPYELLSSEYGRGSLPAGGFRYVGIPIIAVGVLLYLRCTWDFTFTGRGTPAPIDPPKELVVKGPYRYVRNPMYVAVFSILLGEALLFEARVLFLYAGVFLLLCYAFVIIYEEPVLKRKFGDSYQSYRRSVPRFFPRLRRSKTG